MGVNDRKCVLLVEDTPSHRKLYSSWLTIGGYEPRIIDDERDAQRCAEALKPSAIIVDIRLPNISGLDVIETLKSAEGTRAIPVLALTVLGSAYDKEACLDAGADAFMSKPTHIGPFLDTVTRLVA